MKPCRFAMRNAAVTLLLAISLLLAHPMVAHAQNWTPPGDGHWEPVNLVPTWGSQRLIVGQHSQQHENFIVFRLPRINASTQDAYSQLKDAAQRAYATYGVGGIVTDSFLNDSLGRYVRNVRAYLDFGNSVQVLAPSANIDLTADLRRYNLNVPPLTGKRFENYYPPIPTYIDEPIPGFLNQIGRKGTGENGNGLPPANELWISFPTRWGNGLLSDLAQAQSHLTLAARPGGNVATQQYYKQRIRLYRTLIQNPGSFTLRVDGEVWIPDQP